MKRLMAMNQGFVILNFCFPFKMNCSCRAMKDLYKWLNLQCMSLIQRRHVREHRGQWSCHLGALRRATLFNRFMRIKVMALKFRLSYPWSGALWCAALTLQHCGLGPYEY